MSYIDASVENRVSPKFLKDFVGTGSTTTFTLTNEVFGGSSQNVMVVVNNVVQEPDIVIRLVMTQNDKPKILTFTGTDTNGDSIYVIHHGLTTILHSILLVLSVRMNYLKALKTFTTDAFTGNGSATTVTLSEIPANSSQIMVFIDGILQKASTNYSLNTTTGVITFTSAPPNNAELK